MDGCRRRGSPGGWQLRGGQIFRLQPPCLAFRPCTTWYRRPPGYDGGGFGGREDVSCSGVSLHPRQSTHSDNSGSGSAATGVRPLRALYEEVFDRLISAWQCHHQGLARKTRLVAIVYLRQWLRVAWLVPDGVKGWRARTKYGVVPSGQELIRFRLPTITCA